MLAPSSIYSAEQKVSESLTKNSISFFPLQIIHCKQLLSNQFSLCFRGIAEVPLIENAMFLRLHSFVISDLSGAQESWLSGY